MPADPRDDFSVFADTEHMFFTLRDPYRLIRDETEAGLRRQVSDTEVSSIVCGGVPKFLTIGRKLDGGARIAVTWFAFCVQARIALTCDAGRQRDELGATLTFLFGRIDEPGREASRVFIDLHNDAEPCFTDEVFQERFVAFRAEAAGDSR
ncbi:MAG TPA: hypothetical protein VGD80_40605 [Kofleriaceae bacterium]